jgi:hypothetical protein
MLYSGKVRKGSKPNYLPEHLHMNKYATKERLIRVLTWIVWFIVLLTTVDAAINNAPTPTMAPVLGIVTYDAAQSGPLFPWQPQHRWKKWALHRYRKWRKALPGN